MLKFNVETYILAAEGHVTQQYDSANDWGGAIEHTMVRGTLIAALLAVPLLGPPMVKSRAAAVLLQ